MKLIDQRETLEISESRINVTGGVEFECLPAPNFSFGKMIATCRYLALVPHFPYLLQVATIIGLINLNTADNTTYFSKPRQIKAWCLQVSKALKLLLKWIPGDNSIPKFCQKTTLRQILILFSINHNIFYKSIKIFTKFGVWCELLCNFWSCSTFGAHYHSQHSQLFLSSNAPFLPQANVPK